MPTQPQPPVLVPNDWTPTVPDEFTSTARYWQAGYLDGYHAEAPAPFTGSKAIGYNAGYCQGAADLRVEGATSWS